MTTAIQASPTKSIVSKLAELYGMEPAAFAATVKSTVFPGGNATNEQLAAFCLVADTYKLNPLLKQIHAFPSKNGGVIPIVGIDGWLTIANANPQFNGMRHKEVMHDGEVVGITCVIHRKDRSFPIEITEWLEECKRDTEPWRKMKLRMLRNRATCQAIRHAFSLVGVMETDEAEEMLDVEAHTVVDMPIVPKSLQGLTKALEARNAPQAQPHMQPQESDPKVQQEVKE